MPVLQTCKPQKEEEDKKPVNKKGEPIVEVDPLQATGPPDTTRCVKPQLSSPLAADNCCWHAGGTALRHLVGDRRLGLHDQDPVRVLLS